MKDKATVRFLIGMGVVAIVVILFGVFQGGVDSTEDSSSSGAKISLESDSFNFGNVSQAAGVVSTSFTIINDGTSQLIIDDMVSSCSCTSATIEVAGEEGPRFGMHNNPTTWSAKLAPGEEVILNVYYDPNVHRDFRGNATREITIYSNDKKTPEKNVRITLRQTD